VFVSHMFVIGYWLLEPISKLAAHLRRQRKKVTKVF
jgi:hypothetical protein